MEDRLIPPLNARWPFLRGTSARSAKSQEPAGLDPFLVSSEGSRRTTEGAGNVVLIRVTRFEQRHHRAFFSGVVIHVIVYENEPLQEYCPLGTLGADADTIVEDNGPGLENSRSLRC